MEKLFEQALNELQNGRSLEQVLLSAPESQKAELKNLLETTLLLSKLPKNLAPTPSFKRKYILSPIKHTFWYSVFHISRFAATSTAVALLFVVFALSGYAAYNSLPGQALFSVKRTAENVRLKFVMSEAAKAQLQLDYAQNRYNEARVILNNPQSSPQQEVAALNELQSQTKTAADSVQSATLKQPLDQTSHPLVSKLENLATQQAALIKTAKNTDAQVKVAVSDAVKATQNASQQAGQIKHYLTIAESTQDSQSLVDLSSDPDAVSISGVIQKVTSNGLTVEKTVFQISTKTEVTNLAGKKFTLEILKPDVKVKVNAKKDQDALVVQNIIVLSPELNSQPEVKGDSTSTPATETSTPASTKVFAPTPTPEANPKVGTFLFEDPNPQYQP